MIQQFIAFINSKITALSLFNDLRGLCELIQVDQSGTLVTFPAEYTGTGTYNNIDNAAELENGLLYHRLRDEVIVTDADDDESAFFDDPLRVVTYPMKAVFMLSKDILDSANDDQYIKDKIIQNLTNAINEDDDTTLNSSLDVEWSEIKVVNSNRNTLEVFAGEFDEVGFNIGNGYMLCSIDYDVRLQAPQSCFDNFDCTDTPDQFFGVTVTDANNVNSPIQVQLGGSYTCMSGATLAAEFSVDDATPEVTDEVSFTDESTGSPTTWCWDFGDGTISNEQNPTHSYELPGTYDVTLTITNGTSGDVETKNAFITVSLGISDIVSAFGMNRIVYPSSANTIDLRRVSDNARMDIGWLKNKFDQASVDSFLSGGEGRIAAWYDQMQNYDVTQGTAGQQPEITSNGVKGAGNDILNNNSFQQFAGDFSICFAMKSDNITNTRQRPFTFGDTDNTNNVVFSFNNGGGLRVYWNGTGSPSIIAGSAGDYTDKKLRYFVFVRSGTTVELFIDGVSVGSSTSGTSFTTDSEITLLNQGTNDPLLGWMDNVFVVNRAITSAERLTMQGLPTKIQPTKIATS